MEKLFVSLILAVVLSVFGSGWLGTQIYSRIDDGKHGPNQDDIFAYKEVGENLAAAIDQDASNVLFFGTFWPENSRLHLSIMPKDDFSLPLVLGPDFENGEVLVLEDEEDIALSFYLKNTQQVLTLSLSKSLVLHKKTNSGLMLTLLFYSGIIIIVLVWLYPLLRRLILLQKSASSFGGGELNSRIAASQWSYIPKIEQAFNNMAERIQNLIADNKLLSRAVSHDLKTPLARLRFGVETLAETHDEKQRDKYHKRILCDLNEMESLVNTLLQYAKLDESDIQLNKQDVNLNELLEQLSQEYECADNIITLNLSADQQMVYADKIYLKMLINNLLANAVQYSKSQVVIKTEAVGGQVCLSIEDDGDGIPVSERDNIFKPFVRGSTKGEHKGHGMGLSIVSKIAEWHDAKIVIGKSEILKGARISAWFG